MRISLNTTDNGYTMQIEAGFHGGGYDDEFLCYETAENLLKALPTYITKMTDVNREARESSRNKTTQSS